jgi:hypothetical protein
MSTPLPTTGISGGISETGVATVEVPMFVDTLAEALSVLPNLGIGIAAPAAMRDALRGFVVALPCGAFPIVGPPSRRRTMADSS